MQEAFRKAAEEASKKEPANRGAIEVAKATQRLKIDQQRQYIERIGRDWERLGNRVYQWDYVSSVEPFRMLTQELVRLRITTTNMPLTEQAGMLECFTNGLRLSEEAVDPIIRRINGTRPLPEILGNPHMKVNQPTLSPVSDLFLHHLSSLAEHNLEEYNGLKKFTMANITDEKFIGYIALPQVLPVAATWIWHKGELK